jgi:ribosomal protein S18 acetylase RimI-like enzyme
VEQPEIRFEVVGERSAVEFLYERVSESNLAVTGLEPAEILLALERDDVGAIIAGIHGWVWGGTAEVDLLWVDEPRRRRGTGGALLTAFEAEARRRGARQVVLDTADFQAPAFYARRGYTEVGRIDDYPTGHALRRMRKRLVASD